jgi:hypothetical protein
MAPRNIALKVEAIANSLRDILRVNCAATGDSIAFPNHVTGVCLDTMNELAAAEGCQLVGVRPYVGRSSAFTLSVDFRENNSTR